MLLFFLGRLSRSLAFGGRSFALAALCLSRSGVILVLLTGSLSLFVEDFELFLGQLLSGSLLLSE